MKIALQMKIALPGLQEHALRQLPISGD